MWQQLKAINFFRSSDTLNNPYQLQNERISTRIYLLTLIISLLISTIYTAQVTITQNPTEIRHLRSVLVTDSTLFSNIALSVPPGGRFVSVVSQHPADIPSVVQLRFRPTGLD